MNTQEILEALRGVRFLQDMPDEFLMPIATLSELKEFPENAVLFREGHGHTHVYMVLQGSVALEVRVSHREVRRIQTVGEGEFLGWSPLLGQTEMTATGRAITPTRTLQIAAVQLLALCQLNAQFGFEFMQRTAQALASRLNATRLQLLDVYSHEPGAAGSGREG